jgi:tRNA A-37 threonylcarbamoyl transferase component Bud32
MDISLALELFDELSDLEAGQRSQRCASLRALDPSTADLLERMFGCAEREHGALDRGLAPTFLATQISPAEAEVRVTGQVDQRIGAFRLVRVLGRGGMGEVWLAEREDADFQQQVAVKLLRHGLERADAARRFIQERRILAGLRHPDIARLIDGGVSASGQSWYAMEYVDGLTIIQHAQARGLDVRARIELITRAAEAVAAAQAQDIVHRDLKPSNIMVDAGGRPRLLDFGIAKWLGPTGGGEETATGLRALSPAYAAPEQILGEPISRATDVYALGMVMYELLVGQLPSQRAHHSLERMAEQVRSEAPTAPSAHARALDGAAAGPIDEALDDIALTCLQREPERRYADAGAMAADLRRWLNGEAVAARGAARRLKWSRWRRRAARPWLAAAGGALLILGAGAWWTWTASDADDGAAPSAASKPISSATAEQRYQAARQQMATGDLVSLQAAEAELQALTAEHPDFMPAYALASRALTELGWHQQIDRGESLRRLRLLSGRALARNPDSLEARTLAAHLRFVESEFNPSQPRYLAALREHELLLREAPDDHGLLLSLANLSGVLGRLEDVLRYARRANQIDASSDQAYVLETRALVGLGRWDEALRAQGEALARSPRRGDTFDYVIEGRSSSGQFAEAMAAVEACRRAGADRCEAHVNQIRYLLRIEPTPSQQAMAKGQFRQSLRVGGFAAGQRWIEAEEAAGREAFSSHAYPLLAVALAEQRHDEALAIIARRSPGLIEGDPALPHETDWLLAAGVAYHQKGDPARATEAFSRALVAVEVLTEPTLAQQAQLPDVVALAWLGREAEALQRMRRYVAAGWSNERPMTENAMGSADPVISVLSGNREFQQMIQEVRERNARVRDELLPVGG